MCGGPLATTGTFHNSMIVIIGFLQDILLLVLCEGSVSNDVTLFPCVLIVYQL